MDTKKVKDILWHNVKDYCLISVGLVLYAIGFCGFILPHKVVIGGMAGVASLIYFQFHIPVAASFYVLNIILLALAYREQATHGVIHGICGKHGGESGIASEGEGVWISRLAVAPLHEVVVRICVGGQRYV